MVEEISSMGCCGSVAVDFYIDDIRKKYRAKKAITEFKEGIKNCPTIFKDVEKHNSISTNQINNIKCVENNVFNLFYNQPLGPPLGLKIENFDYYSYIE